MQEFVLDNSQVSVPKMSDHIFENRTNFYQSLTPTYDCEITIFVVAYNRLDKTKRCVESILKYTKDIDYKLVLIDNGSEPDIMEYYRSIQQPTIETIRIEKNTGTILSFILSMSKFWSPYYVVVMNDIVVTENWLRNMLICMKSDPKIGYVVPMSSNVSNLQEVCFQYSNLEELQKKAAEFNKESNPRKWEERLRLISVIMMLRKEAVDLVGCFDAGYAHDFLEDDYSIRIRRAGFKLMLCGDTFIHHDHDFRNMEDKDPVAFQKSLDYGRKAYQNKYCGIDAWDDISNYEVVLCKQLSKISVHISQNPTILGVDTKCGMPILQVKNYLRSKGKFDCSTAAYTTDAKYFLDLQYVTDGHAQCGSLKEINIKYAMNSFDFIVVGTEINYYPEPITCLQTLLGLLKPNGILLFKLKNTADIYTFMYILGIAPSLEDSMPLQLAPESLENCIKLMGGTICSKDVQGYSIAQDTVNLVKQSLEASGICRDVGHTIKLLHIQSYIYAIKK